MTPLVLIKLKGWAFERSSLVLSDQAVQICPVECRCQQSQQPLLPKEPRPIKLPPRPAARGGGCPLPGLTQQAAPRTAWHGAGRSLSHKEAPERQNFVLTNLHQKRTPTGMQERRGSSIPTAPGGGKRLSHGPAGIGCGCWLADEEQTRCF